MLREIVLGGLSVLVGLFSSVRRRSGSLCWFIEWKWVTPMDGVAHFFFWEIGSGAHGMDESGTHL